MVLIDLSVDEDCKLVASCDRSNAVHVGLEKGDGLWWIPDQDERPSDGLAETADVAWSLTNRQQRAEHLPQIDEWDEVQSQWVVAMNV